ncbi:T9SS type A sorting domain-containing protein [Rhodocytophaga aerolata]|uniref:T9SS type A sorting domain-containing protein n=1 Tax=Rhodocytophaga aerolata TaxID=455078 RepID=A0ABT8R4W7_9BACT|nr:T9SS type A sorting domain-containing protein [Rhodocytophaga aerolata]MDO1447123.1 T9SS type A sorting domain-containing protein [Rhodocytophaga aerolata]
MKHLYQLLYLIIAILISCESATAQTYIPDPAFQSPTFRNPGGNINTIATQPDGKILIGGSMHYVNGVLHGGIARLHPDGSVDNSFRPPVGQPSEISAIKILSTGKILINGSISLPGEGTKTRLMGLHADGSVDAAFKRIEGQVNLLAVQADDKMLVSMPVTQGDFTSPSKLVRLYPDGSIDATFTADEKITNRIIYTIEVQADGKIIVAGEPALVNGLSSHTLFRLLPDGSLDPAFSFGEVSQKPVLFTVLLQNDGKMLVGGFSDSPIPYKTYIRRLNSDGSIDTSFQPATLPANGMVLSLGKQPDGKLLAGGWFYTPNPNAVPYGSYHFATNLSPAYRLEADGSLDNSFTVDSKVINFAGKALKILPDGRILAGNSTGFVSFTGVNSSLINAILCLNTNGSLNESFLGEVEVDGVIYQTIPQPGGKILAAGLFKRVGNKKREGLVQINIDGSVDDAFVPSSDMPPIGYSIPIVVKQPDGKVLVGGIYNDNGGVYKRLYRLNPEGSMDYTFDAGNNALNRMNVRHMVVMPDNKIVVGGGSLEHSIFKIARLHPDGGEDVAFKKETGFGDGFIYAMVLQADGKILVASGYQGDRWSTRYFDRISSDGSLDKTFKAASLVVDSLVMITSVIVQADKKIVISGTDASYQARIIRLNEDGSIDASYRMSNFERSYYSTMLQPDGKIIVYGYSFATQQSKIIRLATDGFLDNTLEIGNVAGFISTLSLLPDNKIMYSKPGALVRLVQEQTVLGVEEYHQLIKVYPNPSPGIFTVTLPDEFREATLQVVNQQGQKMPVKYVRTQNSIFVEAGKLPAGIYLVHLFNGKTKISRKIIIN